MLPLIIEIHSNGPAIKAAARQLGIEPIVTRVHDDSEMDRALAAIGMQANAGLIVPPAPLSEMFRIIETMARYRVPAIYWSRTYAAEGGLVAYGSDEPKRLISRQVSGHCCRRMVAAQRE